MNLAADGKTATYQAILNRIYEFQKSKDYPKFREVITVSKTLESKEASLISFDKDKELFLKLQMTPDEIEKFRLFLEVHVSEKMSYKEAFSKYMKSKPNYQSQERKILAFNDLVDIESAIKIGKENNKRILVYFTCYACVSARKMEDRILTDEYVKTLITQKFVYFAAYVDDKRPDEKNSFTIGNRYIRLQQEKFKSSYQPYFYVLNDKGEVLAETGYTANTEEFKKFLNKGLK